MRGERDYSKTKLLLKGNVAEMTGAHASLKGDFWGIEFENELDANKGIPDDKYRDVTRIPFDIKKDGSLRGDGYEFISKPRTLDVLKSEVNTLCDILKPLEWSYSRRTSTHIHLNFGDKKVYDVTKFMYIYYMFEPIIFASLKPTRWHNTFCQPSISSRDVFIESITRDSSIEAFFGEDGENAYKYSSLNLATLSKLATVECRIFHSSFDVNEICRWLDTLNAILLASRAYKTLSDIRTDFNKMAPETFVASVLGVPLKKFYAKFGDIQTLLRKGFKTATPLFQLEGTFKDIEDFFQKEQEREEKRLAALQEALQKDVDITMYLMGADPAPEAVQPVPPAPPVPEQRDADQRAADIMREIGNVAQGVEWFQVNLAPQQWRVVNFDHEVQHFPVLIEEEEG